MSTTDASNSYAQADEYIQYKLQKARRRIKLADLLTAALLAAVLLLGYVLTFTVLDHWVVADGFSPWTRAIGLGLVVLMCCIIVVRYVVIPWFKTIHPLYAARVLDSSGSGLRGALVSLVDLKSGDEQVTESVRAVMEKRAAVSLADVNVDDAIDQRWLMKLGIALFVLVVLTSFYALASPKGINLLRPLSVANAAVATQTQILKVTPGTTTIAAGESLEVAVDLGGLIPEDVTLEFTTRDKTYVNEVLTLTATDSDSKFQTIIVGDSERGLRQDFSYRIQAGDAISGDFKVTVDQPPTANVLELNYDYPTYMMMPRQETADGNIAAWEGTKVQLVAEASVPIKRATLEFSDSATFDVPAEEVNLIVQEQQILGQFTLQLRDDRSSPKFYRIAVQDFDGRIDPQPTVYAVNIRPDKAPVVKLLDPIRDMNVPANAIVPLLVQAEDPDFMLRNVKLELDVNGEIRTPELLYDGTRTPLVQKWTGRFDFRLEDLEVRAGDVINYRVTARDNKPPLGTMSESGHLKLSITQKVAEEQVQKRLEQDRQMQEQEFQQQQGEADQQEEQAGQGGEADEGQTSDENAAEGQEGSGTEKSNSNGESPDDGNKGAGQNRQPGEQDNDSSQEQQAADPNQPSKEEAAGNDEAEAGADEQNRKNQTGRTGENSKTSEGGDQQEGRPDGATGDAAMDADSSRPGEELNADDGEPGESRAVDDEEAMQKLLEKYRNENGGIDPPSDNVDPNESADGGTDASSEKQTAEGRDPQASESNSGDEKKGEDDSSEERAESSDDSSKLTPDNQEKQGSSEQKEPESGNTKDGSEGQMGQEDPESGEQNGQQSGDQKSGEQNGQQGVDQKSGEQNGQQSGDQKSGEQSEQQGGDQESGEQNGQQSGDQKSGEQNGQQSGDQKSGEQNGQQSGDQKSGEQNGQQSGDQKSGEQNGQQSGDQKSGEQGGQQGGDQKSGEQNGQQSGDQKSGEQNGQQGGDQKSGEQGGKESGGKKSGEQSGQKGGDKKSGEQGGQEGADQKSGEQGGKKGGGKEPAQQGSQQNGGKPGQSQSGTASGSKGGMGAKGGNSAGPQGDSSQSGNGKAAASEFQSEDPDIRSSAEAADLVLKRLQRDLERGEVDQDLLKELGWTQEQLKQFNARMRKKLDTLKDTNDPSSKAEHLRRRRAEELLKSLDLKGDSADRIGGSDNEIEQQDTTSRRSTPPAKYKDWMELFQRGLSKGKPGNS